MGEAAGGTIGLAVVDNDPYSLRGLTAVIGRMRECTVLWRTELGTDALRRCMDPKTASLDVMIVDMSLDDISGIEVCRRVRRRCPGIGLVGVTAYSPERFLSDAAACGMQTLIEKRHVFERLPQAIRLAAQGRAMQTDAAEGYGIRFPDVDGCVGQDVRTAGFEAEDIPQRLSSREMQTMRCYAQGCSTDEVAANLGVNATTVYSYQKRALNKLHARTLPQAVCMLAKKGLL